MGSVFLHVVTRSGEARLCILKKMLCLSNLPHVHAPDDGDTITWSPTQVEALSTDTNVSGATNAVWSCSRPPSDAAASVAIDPPAPAPAMRSVLRELKTA